MSSARWRPTRRWTKRWMASKCRSNTSAQRSWSRLEAAMASASVRICSIAMCCPNPPIGFPLEAGRASVARYTPTRHHPPRRAFLYGGPGTGIGPALRKARQTRGKSIEEASRDTRIRSEYLQALEREAFGSLRGDVYVRGFLRSYSSYLGLNPDKVVSVYVRAMGKNVADVPEPPPLQPLRQATLHKVLHRRGNWKLAVAIAIVGLAAAGALG